MKFFKAFLLAFLVCGSVFSQDPKGVHGMLVFGKSPVYLSHLPMFHVPHHYQWVMQVELPPAVQRLYSHSNPSGAELFTLVPEPFVLPDVAEGMKRFKATLYSGHFERGGKPITAKFEVKILKNLIFKKFNPNAVAHAEYQGFLIGKEKFFLVHSIVKAPDFDQIVEVGSVVPALKLDEVSAIPVFTENNEPVKENSQVLVNKGTDNFLRLELKKEVYLETGELEH